MHRPVMRVGVIRMYTSRAPAGPRLDVGPVLQVLDLALVGDRVRVALHQDAPAFVERLVELVASKLTWALAYSASSVSGAVRKMMALAVMAKLTGSITIPSAELNPTRPMPPGSSRSKHSSGLSFRRVRWRAAGPGPADSASRLLADPFDGCHGYSPLPLAGCLCVQPGPCALGVAAARRPARSGCLAPGGTGPAAPARRHRPGGSLGRMLGWTHDNPAADAARGQRQPRDRSRAWADLRADCRSGCPATLGRQRQPGRGTCRAARPPGG